MLATAGSKKRKEPGASITTTSDQGGAMPVATLEVLSRHVVYVAVEHKIIMRSNFCCAVDCGVYHRFVGAYALMCCGTGQHTRSAAFIESTCAFPPLYLSFDDVAFVFSTGNRGLRDFIDPVGGDGRTAKGRGVVPRSPRVVLGLCEYLQRAPTVLLSGYIGYRQFDVTTAIAHGCRFPRISIYTVGCQLP